MGLHRVVALCLGLGSISALAQSEADELSALATRAPIVAVVKVVAVESRVSSDPQRLITETRVVLTELIKGDAPRVLTLLHPGGAVGDRVQRFEGVPQFEVGEEVLVFLEPRPAARYRVLPRGKRDRSDADRLVRPLRAGATPVVVQTRGTR